MDDRLSPEQRREVAAIAQEKARATVSRLLDRSEGNSSKAGVNRRTALKITGLSGLLGLAALGSESGVDTAAAGNHEDEDDDEDEDEEDGEDDDENGAGLKNLISGQWNLRDPQHWVVRPSAPPKGVIGPSVVHDGAIYCFGGRHFGDPNNPERKISAYVIRHQGTKNTWVTDLATPPQHLGGGAATSVDDAGYVLTTDGFFKYSFPNNPVTEPGSWSTEADEANGDSVLSSTVGLAAVDGDVYRVGDNEPVYRFNGSSWSEVNDDSPNQRNPAAVTHDGEIYMIGGSNAHLSVSVFDPNTATWDEDSVSDLPVGASSHSVTIRDEKLYVLGGTSVATQVYDFETDNWDIYPGPHEDPASYPAVGTHSGPGPWHGIYAFGGGDEDQRFRADVMGPVD